MRRIGIFCGANPGHDPRYMQMAAVTGRHLAEEGIAIVYGGGHTGLMGAVADGALTVGGEVIGVMPHALIAREVQHTGLTELRRVDTMQERKLLMAELADGFIALPGGAGTFEEIFEQWSWALLGIHRKPCAFLDINDYFDSLRRMIARCVNDGFMSDAAAATLTFSDKLEDILAAFRAYRPPPRVWSAAPPP